MLVIAMTFFGVGCFLFLLIFLVYLLADGDFHIPLFTCMLSCICLLIFSICINQAGYRHTTQTITQYTSDYIQLDNSYFLKFDSPKNIKEIKTTYPWYCTGNLNNNITYEFTDGR